MQEMSHERNMGLAAQGSLVICESGVQGMVVEKYRLWKCED